MAEKPEDLNLPLAVVSRIIKDSLPENINVSKEARQAISKAASVFVLYATSCANNFALKGKRKTLAATDIFQAMEEMEFERFVPELKKSLEVFSHEKKMAAEKKKQQKEKEEEIANKEEETNEDKNIETEADGESEIPETEESAPAEVAKETDNDVAMETENTSKTTIDLGDLMGWNEFSHS